MAKFTTSKFSCLIQKEWSFYLFISKAHHFCIHFDPIIWLVIHCTIGLLAKFLQFFSNLVQQYLPKKYFAYLIGKGNIQNQFNLLVIIWWANNFDDFRITLTKIIFNARMFYFARKKMENWSCVTLNRNSKGNYYCKNNHCCQFTGNFWKEIVCPTKSFFELFFCFYHFESETNKNYLWATDNYNKQLKHQQSNTNPY